MLIKKTIGRVVMVDNEFRSVDIDTAKAYIDSIRGAHIIDSARVQNRSLYCVKVGSKLCITSCPSPENGNDIDLVLAGDGHNSLENAQIYTKVHQNQFAFYSAMPPQICQNSFIKQLKTLEEFTRDSTTYWFVLDKTLTNFHSEEFIDIIRKNSIRNLSVPTKKLQPALVLKITKITRDQSQKNYYFLYFVTVVLELNESRDDVIQCFDGNWSHTRMPLHLQRT